jgi:hypothetical protein
MNPKRNLIGWTLSILGLAALVVLIAVPVLLISPLYTACQQQATTYSQPLLPTQFVDHLILSLGLQLYAGIWLYMSLTVVLLVAGWLLTGTLSRRGLRLAVTVLFALGLAWLGWSTMRSYAYTASPAWVRSEALKMETPKELYTHDEAAANIWQFATPIPNKLRADLQWPVFGLLLVHVLARFSSRFTNRKCADNNEHQSKRLI